MSKIDRRIPRTKAAINKAFIELLSEKNFDHITINDISDRANINRGTVYLHYVDKFDLLDKCIEDHLSTLLDFCVFSDRNQETLDVMGSFLPVFLYFEENYIFYSTMLANKGTPSFRDRFQSVVIKGLKEQMTMNGINRELDKDVIAQFMASAFVGTVEWWLKNKMPHPPQVMAQHILVLYMRNLEI